MGHALFSHQARRRVQRDMQRAVAARMLNVNTVKFHWEVATGGEVNRYIESEHTATYAPKWVAFPGWVHFVQPIESGLRRHMEVETGDVIIDVVEGTTGTDDEGNTGVALVFEGAGKERPRFELDGEFFVQKSIGADLAKFWDVKLGDARIMRTFLLTRMK